MRIILAWTLCFFGIAVLVSGIIFAIKFEYYKAKDWAERGQRGDFYGGYIGATSSLAGSFLVFAAILFQAWELHLQREQLKLQSEGMKQAIDIHEKQAAQIKEQTQIAQHHSTFSQILEIATFKFKIAEEMRVVDQKLRRAKSVAAKKKLVNVPETNEIKCDRIYYLEYERRVLTHQWGSCVEAHQRLLRSDCLSEAERANLDDIVFAGALGESDPPYPEQRGPISNDELRKGAQEPKGDIGS